MVTRRRISCRLDVAAVTFVALAALTACSGGDGTDIDAQGRAPDEGGVTAAPTVEPGNGAVSSAAEVPPSTGVSSAPGTDQLGATAGANSTAQPAPPPPTATPVPEIPETGVPGLDSDDAFCAAWSRFGGSFQVIAVNAAFGAGSIEDRAFIEVAAGPTVVAAHAEMADNWPEELESEASIAIDDVFGPLARRLASASDALVATGASPAQIEALDEAWVAFLAGRDPTDAEVALVVDDDLNSIVAAAVPVHLGTVGPWAEDDSLITDESTPLTDEYLAARCPDQGTLAGEEVG